MTSLALRRARRQDDGIAMIMVIAMCMIVFMFVGAMFTAVLSTQLKTRYQGDITAAQTAAEAGINDWVYQLNQRDQATGQQNWTLMPTLYTQASPSPWTSIGKEEYRGYFKSTGNPTQLEIWMTGRFPIGANGNTRTIKVIVAREAPAAFNFSMFASKGIDIHHHGSSPLSPQIVTNGVHSNGYINIDYSAEFTANTVEAVGNLTFQKGGSIWSTNVTTNANGRYYWLDKLPTDTCYPGATPPPCTATYSPNASISGVVRANSVTMGNKGQVLPVPAGTTTEAGAPVSGDGSVYAATASLNGTSYSTPGTYTAANCAQCGKGSAATAGQIGGNLVLASGYAPSSIPFPSLDYSVYRNRPTTEPEPGGAAAHVFASSTDFLNFITDKNNSFYQMVKPDGTLRGWNGALADGAPNAIVLDGTYDITGGSLSLDWGTMKSMVNAATGTTGPAPLLIIRGSLIVETGNIDISTGIVMVGKGNRLDFLKWQGTAPNSWPTAVDSSKLLDPAASEPAVMAAGGTIDAHDYDTDSDWTDLTKYEPMKATPIYIRGLVYAAKWDATNKVSVPQNMHWHNYDPKNITKIYGAQVGAQLHDCNSFSFTYDPIVQAAFGFGSAGKAHVIDYQEIGR